MRIVSKGKKCFIKLEDKTSGELFAKAPIDKYPGIAVEAVMDSSRYFVLRIEDDNGRAAFIGIGFSDRGDSFDLNVTLQEHFKWIQSSEEIEKDLASSDGKSNLDLGFKEGQTITINMNIGKKSGSSKPRPKTNSSGGLPGLLPPPPGGIKIPPPSINKGMNSQPVNQGSAETSSNPVVKDDLLLDLGSLNLGSSVSQENNSAPKNSSGTELWGDFATATGNSSSVQQPSSANSWIDF
nr:adaptin ear-binding coat-associated protein 1 isoform X2 [Parasteatoda tepidariorum]